MENEMESEVERITRIIEFGPDSTASSDSLLLNEIYFLDSPQIMELVRHKNVRVREWAAGQFGIPDAIAQILADDPEVGVRAGVAGNTSVVSAELLVHLARDEELVVRMAVARRATAPGAVIAALAQDPTPEIRKLLWWGHVCPDSPPPADVAWALPTGSNRRATRSSHRKLYQEMHGSLNDGTQLPVMLEYSDWILWRSADRDEFSFLGHESVVSGAQVVRGKIRLPHFCDGFLRMFMDRTPEGANIGYGVAVAQKEDGRQLFWNRRLCTDDLESELPPVESSWRADWEAMGDRRIRVELKGVLIADKGVFAAWTGREAQGGAVMGWTLEKHDGDIPPRRLLGRRDLAPHFTQPSLDLAADLVREIRGKGLSL